MTHKIYVEKNLQILNPQNFSYNQTYYEFLKVLSHRSRIDIKTKDIFWLKYFLY